MLLRFNGGKIEEFWAVLLLIDGAVSAFHQLQDAVLGRVVGSSGASTASTISAILPYYFL